MALLVGGANCESCAAEIGERDARYVVVAQSGETLQFCRRGCYEEWLDRPAEDATTQLRKRARGIER